MNANHVPRKGVTASGWVEAIDIGRGGISWVGRPEQVLVMSRDRSSPGLIGRGSDEAYQAQGRAGGCLWLSPGGVRGGSQCQCGSGRWHHRTPAGNGYSRLRAVCRQPLQGSDQELLEESSLQRLETRMPSEPGGVVRFRSTASIGRGSSDREGT